MIERAGKVRLDNIDLLRALAIAAVVLFHFTSRFPQDYYGFHRDLAFAPYGALGVDLFFIVSGYCIWMTAQRTATVGEFWLRRLSRIEPTYIVGVLLTFALVSIIGLPGRGVHVREMLGNLVWLGGTRAIPYVDGVYWTLIVELKFYLLFGLLLMLTSRRSAVDGWAGFTLVGLLLRLAMWAWGPAQLSWVVLDIFLSPYAALFLGGMVIFEWDRLGHLRRTAYTVLSVATLAAAGGFNLDQKLIITGLLPFSFLVLRHRSLRIPPPVRFIGLVSYPLYLIHQNIGVMVIRELAPYVPSDGLRIAAAIGVVVGLAAILSVTVENPLRPRFERLVRGIFSLFPRVSRACFGSPPKSVNDQREPA